MLGKLAGWGDTIVALATPPGIGAIGVIRVSGLDAFRIVGTLFTSKDLSSQTSHTLHVGLLVDNGEPLDEAVVSLFRGPRSYTGENIIEISCHGSPVVQERVIQALLRHGARLAKAGEFTQRAFLNGKLDLAQAEAVADLIASQSAASASNALATIRGGFSRALKELRERLISFSALIELELDFSQEDVEFADRTQLYHLIAEAETMTSALLQSFRLGNVIKNGVSVAIVGKPNAGKSTLLNKLLNEERAIVSEIAGTTRDTIEETLNIGGIVFRLIDTAGIRQHTTDVIEQIGVGRSLEKMAAADVVVYVYDARDAAGRLWKGVPGGLALGDGGGLGNQAVVDEVVLVREDLIRQGKTFLLVGNKVDLVGVGDGASEAGGAGSDVQTRFAEEVLISALESRGVEVLKQRLVDLVLKGETVMGEGAIVTNARHYEALKKVFEGLGVIRKGLDDRLSGDLLSLDIRHCLHYLGEITGEITSEDRLDYIFSKFCIGK